jgi:hypothetical protein
MENIHYSEGLQQSCSANQLSFLLGVFITEATIIINVVYILYFIILIYSAF